MTDIREMAAAVVDVAGNFFISGGEDLYASMIFSLLIIIYKTIPYMYCFLLQHHLQKHCRDALRS